MKYIKVFDMAQLTSVSKRRLCSEREVNWPGLAFARYLFFPERPGC